MLNNLKIKTHNYILLLWMLACICVINKFLNIIPNLDYLVWIVSCVIFIIKVTHKYTSDESKLLLLFALLVLIQAIGCLQNLSIFSLRNLISSTMTMVLLTVLFILSKIKRSKLFNIFYFLTLVISLSVSIGFQRLGNTLPACIVFLTVGFLLYNIKYYQMINKEKIYNVIKKLRYLFFSIPIAATLYITFHAESRSSLAVLFIIICSNFIFQLLEVNKTFLNRIFLCILIIITFSLIIYINLTKFSWFKDLNFYSQLYFDKNINSGRDYIWSYTFSNMEWWQFIIGCGTGKLPAITRYAESSFHNTFIQLFVQNGIIGLSILIAILRYIWNLILANNSIKDARLSICIFIGVIIYNCFECTLIANKAFLGSIQWILLAIAADNKLKE